MLVIELRYFPGLRSPRLWCQLFIIRGVVPVVPGVPWYPQIVADQLTLHISIRGGRLCPPNNTGTPDFLDLPAALIVYELYS